MLKYYVSTNTSVFMQIWRRQCFHRVKYHLHRFVGFASGVVRELCDSCCWPVSRNSAFDSDDRCVCTAVLHAGTMPEIFSGERNPDNGALHLAKQAPYTKMILVLSQSLRTVSPDIYSDGTRLTNCRLY